MHLVLAAQLDSAMAAAYEVVRGKGIKWSYEQPLQLGRIRALN
jgi:hypothetical protein